ncbi:MAG: AraC family transcriptional regulator [Waddliaceae bacterium]|nr:AraC family transcriptional regulator [Waddliaceae bacterium]
MSTEIQPLTKIEEKLPAIKLIGIQVRTNNENEFKNLNGKIFPCVQKYFQEALFEKIPNRKKPGTTFCAYTEYESDYTGDYTYLIGEEVNSFDFEHPLPEGFEILSIPEQTYAKFTTAPAPMPNVLSNAWQEIWETPAEKMGGERSYHTDFELYDERAKNPNETVLDIYIGIK